MNIIRREGKWRLLDRQATLLLMDERTLDRIVSDPTLPLMPEEEKGVSGEKHRIYDEKTSLLDVCREGQADEARRLEVSYDFFFGGSRRENYPDSPATLKAYKVIADTAAHHGMAFSASVVSPLDVGGGYARLHGGAGRQKQFKECAIGADGSFTVEMALQTQWTNNKGPIALRLREVRAYAFSEARIPGTPYYYVDENAIEDISTCVRHETVPGSVAVSQAGYGRGRMIVSGRAPDSSGNRCLVVAVYETPELDYFNADAGPYMKSVIDQHAEQGIRYAGFYSDEMHIQFDWDLENHFGHDSEINTRYVTDSLAAEYARRYGDAYWDFAKYLVYFAYHQHDFLGGEEGTLPSQHVMGPDAAGILETWRFRKRYYELLQRRVVDLCLDTKAHAEAIFGGPILTRAHSTWQESPTCDRFFDAQRFSLGADRERSRYEYTPEYVWSSSVRENISACYDYFKWNEYLTGGGTDHPEGGFLDRNYYGSAFAASLALLNRFPFSYYGFWGGPKAVMDRLADVGVTYGNQALGSNLEHNFVQGMTPRICDILSVYPLDLNSVEERFGSWMVQYGYTDYITEEQLQRHFAGFHDGKLAVGSRQYGTLLVLYSPLASAATLDIARQFVSSGGRVLWCSSPAMDPEGDVSAAWRQLFGVEAFAFGAAGVPAAGAQVRFEGVLAGIEPMDILTDMLPDFTYPIHCAPGAQAIAKVGDAIVGTRKADPSGGCAVFLGARLRDDQSRSLGRDISTLFDVLSRLGCYGEGSAEALSRPAGSRYIVNRFPNGAVSLANHMRTIREGWYGSFFRDEAQDNEILKHVALTPEQIELCGHALFGHTVSYAGKDALTYRLDDRGRLDGFAGRDSTGIAIDGQDYRFTDEPADLCWFHVAPEDLGEGLAQVVALRVAQPCRVTLPLDGVGMQAALCGRDLHDIKRPVEFAVASGAVMIDVGPREAGQWLALYRTGR